MLAYVLQVSGLSGRSDDVTSTHCAFIFWAQFQKIRLKQTNHLETLGKESHIVVWKLVQRLNPRHLYRCKRVSPFLIDNDTILQIGSHQAWLWVAVELIQRQILALCISGHKNMIVVC
jgi:hypothetical protein